MKYLPLILLSFFPLLMMGQTYNSLMGDEGIYYAQTKQVNQFFRRFNGEEDIQGNKLVSGDNFVRDIKMRKKFLPILFDNSSSAVNKDMKELFINQVLGKNPVYLDFHGKDWFAEVSASFLYKKEKVTIILYLKIEKQHLGYKWVFSNVYFDRYAKWFTHVGDTTNNSLFLHPMSHEIDFMNLDKVFRDDEKIDYYLESTYTSDLLALFVEDVKAGNLKFESVNSVKFHFFQVPGWYFEVVYQNRKDMNSGWLITNLLHVNAKEKSEIIRNYT
ncbi:MAG: hypothetical protein WCL00_08960, partial [Bacteroidota bacterium]